ncbi:TPA: hypothetical protein ACXE0Z_003939 [Enterobacter cloacae]
MNLKSTIATIIISSFLIVGDACAAWTCPNNADNATHRIDGVGYDNNYFQPRVHFASQSPDNWSYLSYGQGLNTHYGKAMLSIALTAYSTGAQVRVRCVSGNDIRGLWISDAGGKSPN